MKSPIAFPVTIGCDTITADMVSKISWNRPVIQVMGPKDFICHGQVVHGDAMEHFAPGNEAHITFHLKDGRVLTTTYYKQPRLNRLEE